MKKGLCFLLSLVLVLSCCSASLASSDEIDLDTVTGAVEYPWEGFRFDPPELYRNTEKGIVIMLGPRDLSEIVDFVPCLYYAMTPERYAEYKGSHDLTIPPEELWTDTLFEVYICRKGMTLRQFCTYSGGFMTDEELEQVPEIARIGDTTWYLRMPGPNPYFLEDVDPAYLDEYTALASARDEVLAGLSLSAAEPTPDPNAGLVGSKLEFTTTDLDGNEIASADVFAQNDITLLNIWATWCGPCIGELEDLQGIHRRMGEKGVGVAGLLIDDDLDAARELIDEFGVKYPVILAPGNLDDLVALRGYPTSLFIGRDGTVLAEPVLSADTARYHTVLNELLRQMNRK